MPRSLLAAGVILGGALAYTLLPNSDPRAIVVLWTAAAACLYQGLRYMRILRRLLKSEDPREKQGL